ncbi:MAG: universal stress protein [Terriglobia bacterium]
MLYRKILLCADNSAHSDQAASQTGILARAIGSTVVAAHVYAARLHDRRFVDLEPGLPKEYQDPKRLEASRRTHDSLIGKGLRLISDSYLEAARARLKGILVEGKSIEGKNYLELAREAAKGYDLAVIGARGLGLASLNGQCAPEAVGSVCERFLRRVRSDVLIVKDSRPIGGTFLVGIDGSPESYAALRRALKLAQAVGARVEAVSCFDPHFHTVAFQSIAQVLSEKAAKVFRFQEQETLHDRIINHGLENLYQGYLDNARIVAQGRGQQIEPCLLQGKPAYELIRRARELKPTLLVLARFGLHRTQDLDIGSTAETVVRLASTNILVVNEQSDDQPLAWTEDAKARVAKVPAFMRPMVRKAIESHARSRGLLEVTAEVVTAAKTGHGVPLPGHGKTDKSGIQ